MKYIEKYLKEESQTLSSLNYNDIMSVAEIIKHCKLSNGVIQTIGNGGSASTATHLCNDLVKKGINSICLSDNISVLTAIGNDISFDDIFSFQVKNYMNKNDALFAFSTSGESKNICKALETAGEISSKTVSITGFQGGHSKFLAKHNINVESNDIQIIEDIHLCISHILACKAKALLLTCEN